MLDRTDICTIMIDAVGIAHPTKFTTQTILKCPIFNFKIRNLRKIFMIASNDSATNWKSDRGNSYIFF